MPDSKPLAHYTVAFRAAASVRFEADGHLVIQSCKTKSGRVDLTFRTRYDDAGLKEKLPRDLWIDAKGTAHSIEVSLGA